MKKAMIACLALLSAFINAPTVLAEQNTETKVNMTVEPTYTISIPSIIQTNADPSLVKKERELTQFKVKATDVVLPGNSFIEVFVHAKNNSENKNVLTNEDGRKLNFNFNRVENTKYGFSDNGNNNSESGIWKIAEFHPVTHGEHITEAPVTMTTEDVLVTSGKYQNTLVFDISLTADMKEKETVTTPFTGIEKVETKEFYEGHEKIIQEARPKIEEIEYDVIYKDGVEISRKEVNRKTVQEGQNKVVEIGTRTEYDDWLAWTETLPSHYVIASDSDFSGTTNGSFRYTGTDDHVVIPYKIKGIKPTSYSNMFRDSSVNGVATNYHSVTNMNSMFYGSSATTLNLSSFDTSKVTDMSSMFRGSSATTLDLSTFDTSSVTNMQATFSGMNATLIGLKDLDVSKVTNMSGTFSAFKGTSIDISNWDTRNVTNMTSMFGEGWRRSGSSAVGVSATGSNNLIEVKGLENLNTSKVKVINSIFDGSKIPNASIFGLNYDLSSLTNMSNLFEHEEASPENIEKIGKFTKNVTDMTGMFYGSRATTLDLSSFDTSNVIYMNRMFQMSSATTLDLSSFDTSSVIDMSRMFYGSRATTLDLSSFNTSSVEYINEMFQMSSATTGYARTKADADRLNTTSSKPSILNFKVVATQAKLVLRDVRWDSRGSSGYVTFPLRSLDLAEIEDVNKIYKVELTNSSHTVVSQRVSIDSQDRLRVFLSDVDYRQFFDSLGNESMTLTIFYDF